MNAQIITKATYQTTEWSGGKTTQFFLYPIGSQFQVGAFDLRISSATIDLNISNFTSLPGYNRILMTLDKAIYIQHNNQEKVLLQPFEKHCFSGEDQTTSYGTCTDFNVIFKEKLKADTTVIANTTISLRNDSYYIIYFVEDSKVFDETGNVYVVDKGECLHIKHSKDSIRIESKTHTKNCAIVVQFK